jgi:hypothetical protein
MLAAGILAAAGKKGNASFTRLRTSGNAAKVKDCLQKRLRKFTLQPGQATRNPDRFHSLIHGQP